MSISFDDSGDSGFDDREDDFGFDDSGDSGFEDGEVDSGFEDGEVDSGFDDGGDSSGKLRGLVHIRAIGKQRQKENTKMI
ncbi:unnamed protein product [Vicia faba]|uniref:Uncharacterized protein n=1 Tax=Vicia faba TaxID=3906 RepID=A0AAV0ZE04_VICFA|nr:unnamed protein product [Vicia faba]